MNRVAFIYYAAALFSFHFVSSYAPRVVRYHRQLSAVIPDKKADKICTLVNERDDTPGIRLVLALSVSYGKAIIFYIYICGYA